MRRKLVTWLLALTSSLFVIPISNCAGPAIQGLSQSLKPCDIFNCVDPLYFDPCMVIQCNNLVRVPTYVNPGDSLVGVAPPGNGDN